MAIQDRLEDWTKAILATDFNFKPGEKFEYNSINGYILSVIVTKVTGKKMVDYLDEKLFRPLGIKDFHWLESPQGYNTGGWGIYLSTEDLAKFGLFILHQGEWKGKQLLSKEWWQKATYPHIPQYKNVITDPVEIDNLIKSRDYWSQGYAYQMWNCPDGAVRMHGANGQLGIIFPDKNAVVIVTSHLWDEKKLLDAIWNNIYPIL
jgi:CubicO group peptidase (beta-lactamase class C family)